VRPLARLAAPVDVRVIAAADSIDAMCATGGFAGIFTTVLTRFDLPAPLRERPRISRCSRAFPARFGGHLAPL